MKKIIILILINLAIPVLILLILPSVFIHSRLDSSQTSSINLVSLTSDKSYSFVLNPQHNNINQIDLQFKNPQIINNSRIIVSIANSSSSRDISFNGSNVGDPSWVTLKFPQIENSLSESLNVTIATDNDRPESIFLITDSFNNPDYRLYYNTGNFTQNLQSNLFYQINNIKNRQLNFTLAYYLIIVFVNFLILRQK